MSNRTCSVLESQNGGREETQKYRERPGLHNIGQNLPSEVKMKHEGEGEIDQLSSRKGRRLKINKKFPKRLNNPATIVLKIIGTLC